MDKVDKLSEIADTIKLYVASFNGKGGVGKTTCATQMSVSFTMNGYKVCFYDLDKQKTASWYFSQVMSKYQPFAILHSLDDAPPAGTQVVIADFPPNLDYIPPKGFTIVAPTNPSGFDIHAYRQVLALEAEGYRIIKVLNNFSLTRNDDKALLEIYPQSVVISQNSAIRSALSNGKTIWNTGHPQGKRAKKQFNHLIKQLTRSETETMTVEKIQQTLT